MSSIPQIQRYQSVNAVAGSLLILCLLTTCLRFYARRVQRVYLGADDYLMLFGTIAFVAASIAVFYGTTHRVIGYPHGTPGATTAENYVKAIITFDMTIEVCMGFVKLSALLFYQRVFCIRGVWNFFRIAVTVCIILVSIWTVVYFILPPFECGRHFSSLWTAWEAKKFCTIGAYWVITQSGIDLAFEVIIILLPIPRIWSLHTTWRRRLAVTFVFLTALISLGASVARLIFFVLIRRMEASGKVTDANLSNTELQWLILLESGIALIAVNLPTVWFIRDKIAPEKVLGSIRSTLSLSSLRSSASKKRQPSKKADEAHQDAEIHSSNKHIGSEADRRARTFEQVTEFSESCIAYEDAENKGGMRTVTMPEDAR